MVKPLIHNLILEKESWKPVQLHAGAPTESIFKKQKLGSTRWAPTSYKWGYNPYKWPKING